MEGKAEIWFQGFKYSKCNHNWADFEDELCRRFGDAGQRDSVEEFNKLVQTGSALEYQERFEELQNLLRIRVPNLSESYFVSCFPSGLNEELRASVKSHSPMTLLEAFEKARL